MPKNILILFFLSSCFLFAQNEKPVRDAFTLKLIRSDKSIYEEDIEKSEYIYNDKYLQIYVGEEIYLELEVEDDEITSMKTVKNNLNPEKTIVISFEQRILDENDEKSIAMMLYIKNPFKQVLRYKTKMYLLDRRMWVPTNVIDVQANLLSMEMWPDPITSLTLYDLELIKP